MKKNILVFSVILILLGCDTTPTPPDTPPPLRFYKSYIQYFRDLSKTKEFVVYVVKGSRMDTTQQIIYTTGGLVEDFSQYYDVSERLGFRMVITKGQEGLYYRRPENPNTDYYYLEEVRKMNRVYDSLVNLIGDTAFNKSMRRQTDVCAIMNTVESIRITSDKAFNAQFPQGSNLSSLFTVFFDDPYATVKSGYTYAPTHYVYKWNIDYNEVPISVAVTNLATADFANRPFIDDNWECILDVAPDNSDSYTFTVEVTLTDGTVFRGTTNPIKIKGKNQ